jgi:hypothetical protein
VTFSGAVPVFRSTKTAEVVDPGATLPSSAFFGVTSIGGIAAFGAAP